MHLAKQFDLYFLAVLYIVNKYEMSSLSFLGNTTSYLRIPNADGFDFGTGNFTIEWYQYQTDGNDYPRIFQVGTYTETNVSIGVSIEGGLFYYWNGNTGTFVKNITGSYKNQWVHFAICRSNSKINVFMNGTSMLINPLDDTTNFNGAADLIIGNESTRTAGAAFGGYITYFTWVKGTALYTSNFTVSNNYPTLTNNYVLLLKASSFTGTLGNTVVNNFVSTTPNVPPNFLSSNNNNNQTSLANITPLFTNNSLVFYKPGSLAAGGVGSVRNSSTKARRT
jgi:hypothetical protein